MNRKRTGPSSRSSRPAVPKRATAGARKASPSPKVQSRAGAVRLQKVLAGAGWGSRRGAEELIVAGRVTVNGKVADRLGVRVDPDEDRICVDGQPITVQQRVYLVLNKPDGLVSSAEREVDERGRPTVVSLLHGITERVYPVGRLDFHTRGVLLLTNDGELASRLTHPRFGVPKTYHAKFQGRLSPEQLQALRDGVTLEDGTHAKGASEVFVVKETATNTWVQLTISQGLYRQVRRMGEAIGKPVLKLIRVAFADITTQGLRDGQWRHLREGEVADLREHTAQPDSGADSGAGSGASSGAKPLTVPGGNKRPAPKRAPNKRGTAKKSGSRGRSTPKGRARGQ